MKRSIRYILLFLVTVIAFLGYSVISITLPVYDYESSDHKFSDYEIPWKGRTLEMVEANFENYKREHNQPELRLYRTSRRIWRSPNLWTDNITHRRWKIPFAEPSFDLHHQDQVNAKRAEPKEVEPVTYKGIKYIAPHFRITDKHVQRGFIEAWDIKSNRKLWDLQVYETPQDLKLERDVQDIFITSLKIEKGKIVVINERNAIYTIDLVTKKIEKMK